MHLDRATHFLLSLKLVFQLTNDLELVLLHLLVFSVVHGVLTIDLSLKVLQVKLLLHLGLINSLLQLIHFLVLLLLLFTEIIHLLLVIRRDFLDLSNQLLLLLLLLLILA